jgi:hypothetical protein
MPYLSVEGRRYDWPDPTTLTFREAKLVKDNLGTSVLNTLNQLQQGYISEDLLLAMFLVAKKRADNGFDLDKILDLSITDIQFVPDEEPEAEDEESPLVPDSDSSEEPKPNEESSS